jgi:hypothetical protein
MNNTITLGGVLAVIGCLVGLALTLFGASSAFMGGAMSDAPSEGDHAGSGSAVRWRLRASDPHILHSGSICDRAAAAPPYICSTTEMPMSCWLKATAKWPELQDRLEYELDEAEKAYAAKQRELRLDVPGDRQDLAA